jgi:hypothetical protein
MAETRPGGLRNPVIPAPVDEVRGQSIVVNILIKFSKTLVEL